MEVKGNPVELTQVEVAEDPIECGEPVCSIVLQPEHQGLVGGKHAVPVSKKLTVQAQAYARLEIK